MEPVRNHRNPVVVEAARLHRARARKERGQTLIAGPHLLEDAGAAGMSILQVFSLPEDLREDATLVDGRAMKRLAGTETAKGPVAVIEIPPEREIGERSVLLSVGVSDPGNVGTLIRTAASFGWAFGYMEGTADPWSPKVLRAGAGGQFQTPVVAMDGPPDLTTVAAVPSGGASIVEVPEGPVAVLIGEEAAGLPADLVASADHRVTIPTSGPTESLNAAVAAGILVYALSSR